ncbi:MAG TPA: sialidase family protein [Longimicrobium sp.]|jgi:hypothetical protein|nr:sialidase family protein [Longimicrobium sp.]
MSTKHSLLQGPDVQVTSGTPSQARSESVIAVNPNNPDHLIAASKKFSNPVKYVFSIGIRVSLDGGQSWADSQLPTLPEWGSFVGMNGKDAEAGMTDPAAVFDHLGNVFYLAEPISYANDIATIGMYVYKSTDGGLSWGQPTPLHVGDTADDKGWIACDQNPASPHFGNVYAVWGASAPLRFARSTDHGASWHGTGNSAPGSQLSASSFAPEISVGLDGTVHIVWYQNGTKTIEYLRSVDGGASFLAQKAVVTGIHSLDNNLPKTDGWPHFPGSTFRVLTLATGCAFAVDANRKHFAVAWSDFREGSARVYFRTSSNAGASFQGPVSGQPLLGSDFVDPALHHFHPQMVATGSGVVGCAYLELGPKNGGPRIDVILSASFDGAGSFSHTVTVTDQPWDPAVDAPFSHGDPNVTFIGEYFGLDADQSCFDVLWTDTRTGVQELFFERVCAQTLVLPDIVDRGIYAQILFGVIQGGGGAVIVGGHIIKIPPRGPLFDLVHAIVAADAAGQIGGVPGRALTASVYETIGAVARTAAERARLGTVAVSGIGREAPVPSFEAELRESLEASATR